MLTCPMCKKKQTALERECPTCHADLTLLIGYVETLAVGLARAVVGILSQDHNFHFIKWCCIKCVKN